jgi:hypothetical protein
MRKQRTRVRAAKKEYGRGRDYNTGGMGSKKGERKAKGEELRTRKVTFVSYLLKGTASRYFRVKVFPLISFPCVLDIGCVKKITEILRNFDP